MRVQSGRLSRSTVHRRVRSVSDRSVVDPVHAGLAVRRGQAAVHRNVDSEAAKDLADSALADPELFPTMLARRLMSPCVPAVGVRGGKRVGGRQVRCREPIGSSTTSSPRSPATPTPRSRVVLAESTADRPGDTRCDQAVDVMCRPAPRSRRSGVGRNGDGHDRQAMGAGAARIRPRRRSVSRLPARRPGGRRSIADPTRSVSPVSRTWQRRVCPWHRPVRTPGGLTRCPPRGTRRPRRGVARRR